MRLSPACGLGSVEVNVRMPMLPFQPICDQPACSELERDRIAQRIRDVKRSQRADGQYLDGSVPFGFRLGEDGKLKPHAAEQMTIAKVIFMKSKGLSLRAISSQLLQDGTKISHVTVGRVLRDSERPPK